MLQACGVVLKGGVAVGLGGMPGIAGLGEEAGIGEPKLQDKVGGKSPQRLILLHTKEGMASQGEENKEASGNKR